MELETGFSERTSLRNGIEGRIRLSIRCYSVMAIQGWEDISEVGRSSSI